jgi:flagellar motor switch protein FliN
MLARLRFRGFLPTMAAFEQAGVELTIVVGAAALPLSRVMTLSRGDLLSLGRAAAGPVSLVANGREIAKANVTLKGDQVAVEVTGKD